MGFDISIHYKNKNLVPLLVTEEDNTNNIIHQMDGVPCKILHLFETFFQSRTKVIT